MIAGGALAADSVNGTAVNNTGPLAQQHFVAPGSASYTYVKSHTFSADRCYDYTPYQLQDIVTNFQIDVTPTSSARPKRANFVSAVASSQVRRIRECGGCGQYP